MQPQAKSEFLDAVQKGVLLGAAVLALVLPPASIGAKQTPRGAAQDFSMARADASGVRHADFAGETPTEDVRQLANWSVHTRDHQNLNFIILDKKDARVWVFDKRGHLKAESPVLLGSAVGDDNAPDIGTKAIADVKPEEKTTAAGRFIAEMGMNTRNEDVVWVDYNAAVSMHRVLTTNADERRLERLATPTPEDNRISYGCINLPKAFYENVVAPTVRTGGAVIYVLPETRSAQQVFGSWDVDKPETRFAQR
ncbi:hypothetical protein [Caenimonas aquaedulcis]|uniref:L,D-TPase catalytic domain-containing protein n=1 Tax=Caenimonas aquaedulcis TaxID=2793270 RepID=A0A931H3F8_9BURK|nr:hypothetical protein [Caenimonas aquaedulcis]MBG9387795.1 hypothetical protein [Caenimonas aquaedulcis]